MKKFQQLNYQRPDFNLFEANFNHALNEFEYASSAGEQTLAFKMINEIRSHFETMMNIVSVKHSINIADKFFGLYLCRRSVCK